MSTLRTSVRRELEIAESVREACIAAAVEGYERAAMSGLCHEGAWEAAISAIRMADLESALALADDATALHPGRPSTRG